MSKRIDFEDVVDELFVGDELDMVAVRAATARHPEHAGAIRAFAAEWLLVEDAEGRESEPDPEQMKRVASLGTSRMMDALWRLQNEDPFQRLTPQDRRRVAKEVGIDSRILLKFERSLIEPDTIPASFKSKLAVALHVPAGVIQARANAGPRWARSTRYKADETPTAVRESFTDAIQTSALDDDLKRYWLKEAEG